ncbi:endo-1,4-beta-xylanase [Planctomycetota bacterium]|nr:endo-1,4-beta-xylanase [Planctomycetota bacterium]
MIAKRIITTTLLLFTLSLLFTTAAHAQVLRGQWVDQTEQQIKQNRMRDVRVIVLDHNGNPVHNASVQITQQRHAFTWGVVLPKDGLAQAGLELDGSQPVWRCFNALSLQNMTQWGDLQPAMNAGMRTKKVRQAIDLANAWGMKIRWGTLIHSDEGLNPEWTVPLKGRSLATMLERYVRLIMLEYGAHVDEFDVYSGVLDRDFLGQTLGNGIIRQLFEQAKADAPKASLCMGFSDSLLGKRRRDMIAKVTSLREALIPVDRLAIDQEVSGVILPAVMSRSLAWLNTVNMNVVISSLHVTGESEAGAALNLEMMLRLLFAEKAVQGVYFSNITPSPNSPNDQIGTLITTDGQLTATGAVLEKMLKKQWWTNDRQTTDELGNANFKVYAGSHRIRVTLPNDQRITATMWIEPPSKESTERLILIEPLKE